MNLDKYIADLKKGLILSERDVRLVCEKVKEILVEESNVQPVAAPVTICGDIHGQFYDLLELFKIAGEVPMTNYVFIGDFVDRGHNSVETLEFLLCLKIKYPAHITLLRGNHESRQISSSYGFLDEVLRKYGNLNVWKYCTDVFDHLGLAALIEGSILCIHGGLSPDVKSLDHMRTIERRMEIPVQGPFSDLMWSDPEDLPCGTWQVSPRGAGWFFGHKVAREFNHLNGLELIARAHQLVDEGYKYWFPENSVVTVWSAPNYCYRCGNQASVLSIDEDLGRTFKLFDASPESAKSVPPRKVLPYFL